MSELNKYLKHYKLISNNTKAEKIRQILLCVLHGEDDQQEHINESTDEEAKEGGTEDNSEDIDNSGEEKREEDIVLTELSSGSDSEQDATSGERECYSINESDKIWFVFQSNSEEEEFYGFD